MVNIAIVDDDIVFLDMIKKKLLDMDKNLNIICYTKPYDFVENIDNIDYVLLDIDLPQIDGITLSKQLRNNDISIFFITSYKELMMKAFGKNVEGFIVKDDIDNGIEHFLKFIVWKKEKKSLIVNLHNNKIKLYLDDILFINYSLRDIEYYLINNKKIIQKNKNLKDVISLLDENFFLINRSMIINLKYVHDFKNGFVFVRNYHFKVSRRKIKSLVVKLFEKEICNENRMVA